MKTLQKLVENKKQKKIDTLKSIQLSYEDINELNLAIAKYNSIADILFYIPLKEMITYFEKNRQLWEENIDFNQSILFIPNSKIEIVFSFCLENITWDETCGYGSECPSTFFDTSGITFKKNKLSLYGVIPCVYSLNTNNYNPNEVNEKIYSSKKEFLQDLETDTLSLQSNAKKMLKIIRNTLYNNIIENKI
jgi:hypothetical protein